MMLVLVVENVMHVEANIRMRHGIISFFDLFSRLVQSSLRDFDKILPCFPRDESLGYFRALPEMNLWAIFVLSQK